MDVHGADQTGNHGHGEPNLKDEGSQRVVVGHGGPSMLPLHAALIKESIPLLKMACS